MKRTSNIDRFYQRMEKLLGPSEARQLIEALREISPKSIRYNPRQSSLDELSGTPVPWNIPYGRYWEEKFLPSQTISYAAGKYYIQEASAMLAISAAARVIDFSDKIVLDLTAAPGGKATQAAESIKTGYLLANEVIRSRVDALVWNVNRHRLNNVIITSLPTSYLAQALPGFFDVVIVDAPCSGEGLFQKRKQSISDWSEKNVLFCARRQTSILTDAVKLLRPGGYIIYSTCTFAPEENEDQVEFLLSRGFRPVPLPADLPVSPAVTENESLRLCSRRIFPHREKGAGAFVGILQKEAGTVEPIPVKYDYFQAKELKLKSLHAIHVDLPSPENYEISQKLLEVQPRGAGSLLGSFEALLPSEPWKTPFANRLPMPWAFLEKVSGRRRLINFTGVPFLRAGEMEGFFYENKGIIGYFSHERIPAVLREKSIQIGAPIMDRRRGDAVMFGAVQIADPEAGIELESTQARDYIRGEDLHLEHPEYPEGNHWVVYGGMVLGLVKIVKDRAVNKLPIPIRAHGRSATAAY